MFTWCGRFPPSAVRQLVNHLVVSGEEAVIGGVIDIILDPGTSINTSGGLFSGATTEEMSVYLGGSVELTGTPNYGDVFGIRKPHTKFVHV